MLTIIQAQATGIGKGLEQTAVYAIDAFLTTVDKFLEICKEAVQTKFGMNIVMTAVLGAVAFMVFIHLYEIMHGLVRTQRVPIEPVKKIGVIFVYIAIATFLGIAFNNLAASGQTMADECIKDAKRSVLAVNVVAVWSDALQTLRNEKRDRMIGQMAGENPDLKTAVDAEAKQTGQSPDPGILEAAKKAKEMFGSAWDKVTGAVKDVMDTIQAIAELGTNVGPLTSKMVTNLIAYCVISLVMLLAYIAFVVVFSYKFLMLFVLFKISLTMYAMFLPPIVMLGIFRHTKTFALNAVRYGIAMLITINLTFPAVQAVFSQSNIKKSIVHALSRNPIGPKETPDGEAMLNQTLKLDVTLSKVMTMPEGMANPFFWAETNVNDMLWGAMSVAEIMFVMAIMAALVLKMYEIVNGTLMGSWNPVSTPIGSGGGSEGSGGGGSDSLQDQAFRYRQAEAAAGKSEK